MSKIKVTFKHYQGFKKVTVDDVPRWKEIGTFSTVEEAREAGATKCRPRYNRG